MTARYCCGTAPRCRVNPARKGVTWRIWRVASVEVVSRAPGRLGPARVGDRGAEIVGCSCNRREVKENTTMAGGQSMMVDAVVAKVRDGRLDDLVREGSCWSPAT